MGAKETREDGAAKSELALAVDVSIKEGFREDYGNIKEMLRDVFKNSDTGNGYVKDMMSSFLHIAMRVRDAEYEKRADTKVYKDAIDEFMKIYDGIANMPSEPQAVA